MKKFDPKHGWEIIIPLLVLFLALFIIGLTYGNWPMILVVLACSFFIYSLFCTTQYMLSDDLLTIKCSFVYKKTINVHSIQSVKPVVNFFSAPATSLYRLEIRFNNDDCIEISPKNEKEFVESLLQINPAISVA